jgi:iron complex outermembrane receptor protein
MNCFSLRRILLAGGGASAILCAGSPAATAEDHDRSSTAASAVEEVIVTARRREESAQTAPVSITAVSAETLENRNIVGLAGITQLAPGLEFRQQVGGLGFATGYIRGIGYGDNTVGQDSPIGVYIDGVSAGRNGMSAMDLVEPDRVEVLRGPQGTLFGRNTTGGAILITSHTPTDDFSGAAKASHGSFNANRFQARIDSGLLGDSGIKFSAAFAHHQRDGVHDAGTRPDRLDPGAERGDAYWFKAVGEWNRFSATLSGEYNELRGLPVTPQAVEATVAARNLVARSPVLGGGSYTITTQPMRSIPFDAYEGEQSLWALGLALTLEYKLTDQLTLKSISALRGYKRSDAIGYGPGNLAASVVTPGTPRIATFQGLFGLPDRRQGQRQKSEEIQLLGEAGDFNFVVGGYYFDENAWDLGVTRLPVTLNTAATQVFEFRSTRYYTVDSKSVAAFGQVDWRPSFLDRKLELSGGVRWTKDKRDFIELVAPLRSPSLETRDTSFLVSANYQWAPTVMTYARYSTGYRAGGFNVRAAANLDPTYQPEKLKSLEAGFKADFLNHRLRVNGSAYHNKYHDLQITLFLPPNAGSAGGNTAVNANATFKGFELELQAVPVDGLTLSAAVGHVDPKFKNYPRGLEGGAVSPGCTPIVVNGLAAGQDCADIASFTQFPKTTASVSAHYVFPTVSYGEWSVFVNYYRRSTVDYSTFNLPSTPFKNVVDSRSKYGVLDARLALSDIPLAGGARGQLAIFGKNLTNETYNDGGIDWQSFATILWGMPRTWGIEGKVEF